MLTKGREVKQREHLWKAKNRNEDLFISNQAERFLEKENEKTTFPSNHSRVYKSENRLF